MTCLGDGITTMTVLDNVNPLPGKAFACLLRYSHPATTTPYGWSSAGQPRAASAGDCIP